MTYKEYNILIDDYLSASKKYFFFDWVIPSIIVIVQACFLFNVINFNDSYIGQCMTLLGILAGFNTTAISVLTTTSNNNIEKLKSTKINKWINGRQITLFQDLYIHISYSVLASFILIIIFLSGLTFSVGEYFGNTFKNILGLLSELFLLNILFLNIRNITSLYFSFFQNQNSQNNNNQ
jgi:hypothetical protein